MPRTPRRTSPRMRYRAGSEGIAWADNDYGLAAPAITRPPLGSAITTIRIRISPRVTARQSVSPPCSTGCGPLTIPGRREFFGVFKGRGTVLSVTIPMPTSRARGTLVLLGLLLAAAAPAAASFVTFESGQVRPLALSPDRSQLFAVNTPDDQLELYTVGASGLTHIGSVPVGLEPVAVAARTDTEVWVVNHLSDSVSIVDVGSSPPRVTRTLLVGDEPRDIVFAGAGRNRAFITCAHRGQNSPVPLSDLTTSGIGRADVWVFDATNLGTSLGGDHFPIITLFGDTPRALAASADGNTVYAAVFESGNRTATVPEPLVCNGGAGASSCNVSGTTDPGGLPAPNTNFEGTHQPETGLIVKFNSATNQWEDRLGRNWNNAIKFSLPDRDVFAIDAAATPPVATSIYTGVGTVLFNMAVNPASGKLYVSNTEARNDVRFEGPGVFGCTTPPCTVRGHLHEARVTVIDPAGPSVTPRHLNKHIDYSVVPSPAGTADASLALPTGMAITQNGATLYLAAFGSSKVGVFNTTQLENDSFVPNAANHIVVSGGGPSGLVLDEPRARLYVFTRFDNAISVINTTTRAEIDHQPVHNPEPASVVSGRRFLYDAASTSSNGEAACASCHIFGDFDSLAWDLGNPDDVVKSNPNPMRVTDPLGISFNGFHPLKGPMTTQSLRGLANHGPMHWRGDRTGGYQGDALNEELAFKAFNVAFGGLLGRSGPLTDAEMQSFTDFILQVTYPPNPIRALDNSLSDDQAAGRNFFLNSNPSDVFQPCNGCHKLDPAQGFFGSDGFSSFENETQIVKIPHLRNMYQKVGMFGMAATPFVNPGDNGATGEQVRGFGFIHDGSVDTLLRFHNATVFNHDNPGGFPVGNAGGFPNGPAGDPLRRQVEQFMLAFDSNLAPIVGQQITLTDTNGGTVGARISLLIARAAAGECDLTVKGALDGEQRGWYRTSAGTFQIDRSAERAVTDTALRNQAGTAGQERTYTCVPPGSGLRIGVDRDGDGFFDRDELDAGTDPVDPASFPTVPTVVKIGTRSLSLHDDLANAAKRKVAFKASTKLAPAANRVRPPAPQSNGDPTSGGGLLRVYNSAGLTTDLVSVPLPASGWSALGSGAAFKGYRFRGADSNAPITQVSVTLDKITIRGGKTNWSYTLNEAAQGRVGVRLTLGTAVLWCADAPAKATGNPPSTAGTDKIGKFIARPKTPAPAVCPPTP